MLGNTSQQLTLGGKYADGFQHLVTLQMNTTYLKLSVDDKSENVYIINSVPLNADVIFCGGYPPHLDLTAIVPYTTSDLVNSTYVRLSNSTQVPYSTTVTMDKYNRTSTITNLTNQQEYNSVATTVSSSESTSYKSWNQTYPVNSITKSEVSSTSFKTSIPPSPVTPSSRTSQTNYSMSLGVRRRRKRDATGVVSAFVLLFDSTPLVGTMQDIRLGNQLMLLYPLDGSPQAISDLTTSGGTPVVASLVRVEQGEMSEDICGTTLPCGNNSTCSNVIYNDYT